MQRIIPNLWINDGKIEEAVDFYCSLFEDSRVVSSTDYGPDAGDLAGQKMAHLLRAAWASPTSPSTAADTRFEANESVSLGDPVRHPGGDRPALGRAGRGRRAGPVRLAQGPLRLQLAGLPGRAGQDDGRPRPREGPARDGLLHGDRQARLPDRRARSGLRRAAERRPRLPGNWTWAVAVRLGFLPRRGTREPATAHARSLRHQVNIGGNVGPNASNRCRPDTSPACATGAISVRGTVLVRRGQHDRGPRGDVGRRRAPGPAAPRGRPASRPAP